MRQAGLTRKEITSRKYTLIPRPAPVQVIDTHTRCFLRLAVCVADNEAGIRLLVTEGAAHAPEEFTVLQILELRRYMAPFLAGIANQILHREIAFAGREGEDQKGEEECFHEERIAYLRCVITSEVGTGHPVIEGKLLRPEKFGQSPPQKN